MKQVEHVAHHLLAATTAFPTAYIYIKYICVAWNRSGNQAERGVKVFLDVKNLQFTEKLEANFLWRTLLYHMLNPMWRMSDMTWLKTKKFRN